MNIAGYWLMAREYSIWNAAIASLQFLTVDLNPLTLGIATKTVYSTSTYTLHQWPDEILFGHFITTLNAAFEWQLALADEGYESSLETINLPTLLRKMPRIHHVSSIKNASFNPYPVMPQSMFQTPPRSVHRWLSFSSSDDSDTSADAPPTPRATPAGTQVCLKEDDEEDFQMVPLDDEHWTTNEVPDHCAYMNMPYHMDYTCIHVLMQITKILPTPTACIWVTFPISETSW